MKFIFIIFFFTVFIPPVAYPVIPQSPVLLQMPYPHMIAPPPQFTPYVAPYSPSLSSQVCIKHY